MSGAQETLEALGHFLYLYGGIMKAYKNNQELIDYLISKNVIINDVQLALKDIEKYTYYSIVNGYKSVFKDEENNYKHSAEEIIYNEIIFSKK